MLFLLISGILFSFDLSPYLYPEENMNMISEVSFSVDGQSYTLIKIGTKAIFLLKDDAVVNESAEIEHVISTYYKDQFYPTDEEINEIYDLIAQFNMSRYNNGTGVMPITEEKKCLYNLFMIEKKAGVIQDKFPCYDQESCELTEFMFCSAVGDKPFSMCQPGDLIEDLKHLSYASIGMDSILSEFIKKLNNHDETTLYSTLEFIKNNINTLKDYAEDVETTVFRTASQPSEKCYYITHTQEINCFKMCGIIDLDQAVLTSLNTKVSALMIKVEPLSKLEDTAGQVSVETQERFEYKKNVELREEYIKSYGIIYLESQELLSEVENTLETKVVDQKLKNEFEQLKSVKEDINSSMENFNFTNIEKKIDDLKFLINKTEVLLDESLSVYDDTMNSKSTAELYFFVLSMKNLDNSMQSEVDTLEFLKEELDDELNKSVPTISKMSEFNESYSELVLSLSSMLDKHKENFVFSKLKSFARKVNSNFNSLINEIDSPDYSKKQEYSLQMPMALSIFNFFSIFSLGLFIFIGAVSRISYESRHRKGRLVFYSGLLFIYGLCVLLFSGGFYFYLEKTSNSADLEEFMIFAKSSEEVSIMLNLENVSSETAASMKSCAGKLENILSSKNLSINTYTINNGCFLDNTQIANYSSESCMDVLDTPSFYLTYSPVSKNPDVKSIFVNQITIFGNKDYYDECKIASVFKVIEFD